jgi:hypothetical protein
MYYTTVRLHACVKICATYIAACQGRISSVMPDSIANICMSPGHLQRASACLLEHATEALGNGPDTEIS